MHLKKSSAKWRPFCLGLNKLTTYSFLLGAQPLYVPELNHCPVDLKQQTSVELESKCAHFQLRKCIRNCTVRFVYNTVNCPLIHHQEKDAKVIETLEGGSTSATDRVVVRWGGGLWKT